MSADQGPLAPVRYMLRCCLCHTRMGWDDEPDDDSLICDECGEDLR